MYYYKISIAHNFDYIVFKCDNEHKETALVLDSAVKNNFLPTDWIGEELCVEQAEQSDYILYLVNEIYGLFRERLEKLKQGWMHKTSNEIYGECSLAVCIGDIMNVLDNAEATEFSEKALEEWLKSPETIVDGLCGKIIERDCSDYNETVLGFINRETEE